MIRLAFFMVRLFFLPFELMIRGLTRMMRTRNHATLTGKAVAKYQRPLMTYSTEPRVRVLPSLHVPLPPQQYRHDGIDLPLPPPPGA